MFDELECSSSELISLYDYDPMREYELRLESEIEITNEKLWSDEDEFLMSAHGTLGAP